MVGALSCFRFALQPNQESSIKSYFLTQRAHEPMDMANTQQWYEDNEHMAARRGLKLRCMHACDGSPCKQRLATGAYMARC